MRKALLHTDYLSCTKKLLARLWLPLLTVSLLIATLSGCKGADIVGLLNPKGIITHEERRLFFDTLALMLIVVLPVIIMSLVFVYHYRASHHFDYRPNWSHSYFLETLWWGIPIIIIFVLAILTWKKTHELDPFNRIGGRNQDLLLIQAIALPWKWLFIYPQQNIATVNYLMVPVDQQVEYLITTDNVPMSDFFIPQLGSQIYAMAGMRTQLHLIADKPGNYDGMNAQFNGDGFSEMHFEVHVVKADQMQQWVSQIQKSPNQLTNDAYLKLLKPTIGNKPQFYSGVQPNLFKDVVSLYKNTFGTVHPRANQAGFTVQ